MAIFGGWGWEDDVWWEVCLEVTTTMFDEIDSVDSVLDAIAVDAIGVEGRLVVTVIIELVETIFGDWLDKIDAWWEGVVCIIIAGSAEHVELFSLILK